MVLQLGVAEATTKAEDSLVPAGTITVNSEDLQDFWVLKKSAL